MKISLPGCHTCPKTGHKIIGGVRGGGHDHAGVMMSRLRNRDRRVRTVHEGRSDRVGDLVASFPSFCAWILELQPEGSQEGIERIAERLQPILVRQLRKSKQWRQVEPEDIIDCQYDVFMFLEKKLREPMEFAVKVLRIGAEDLQVEPNHVKVMHLFRAEPFAIVAHHPDFQPSHRFRACLRDSAADGEVTATSGVSCGENGRVPIRLAYETLRHEQVATLELLAEEEVSFGYYSGVKSVRHESFDVRMGFVVETARLMARNRAWKERKQNAEILMEDMSAVPAVRDNSGQRIAEILARKAVSGLSPTLRDQLFQHYVDGVSWTVIADRHKTTADNVKKSASRALNKVAEAIVAGESGAARGAVERVVKWLQDMLRDMRW
jgi:hypothetical protein